MKCDNALHEDIADFPMCGGCYADLKNKLSVALLQNELLQKQVKSARECADVFEKGLNEEFHRRQAAELQIDEIKKAFRLSHSCVDGKCWMCMGKSVVDHVLSITEKPVGERQRCQETMASDFVCGEYLPCKVHAEKRIDELPQCTECLERSADVRPYCHNCFMT